MKSLKKITTGNNNTYNWEDICQFTGRHKLG